MTDKSYRVFIDDNQYSGWRFIQTETQEDVILDYINPLEYKMFNNDIFSISDKNIEIKISTTREQIIPGVLILDKNLWKT